MVRSILIIKTSAIGDVIQAFSALELLKEAFPEAEIDWVVEEGIAPLVRAHPAIHEVFPIRTKFWKKHLFSLYTYKEIFRCIRQLRNKRYDLVLDLQGNSKSGVVNLFVRSGKKVGFDKKSVAEWPNLLTTNYKVATEHLRAARSRYLCLARVGAGIGEGCDVAPQLLLIEDVEAAKIKEIFSKQKRPVFVIGFGSRWENKKISPGVFKGFLQDLQKTLGASFIFPHTTEEKQEALVLSKNLDAVLIENAPLSFCQHLIHQADGFIGVDSALLHLAQSTQTPVFAIFGPSSGSFYTKSSQVALYQGSCPYNQTFAKRCPLLRTCKDSPCTKSITQENLREAFRVFWESISGSQV